MFNYKGLFRDTTSNGFIIDDTSPVMARGPVFSNNIGIDGKTQFYRTFIKVEWDVNDKESFIEKQYVSIRSHIGGDFDLPSEEVRMRFRMFECMLYCIRNHITLTYTYFITVKLSCLKTMGTNGIFMTFSNFTNLKSKYLFSCNRLRIGVFCYYM